MKATVNKVRIEVIEADILDLAVDVVVVVTDPNLTVDESLHQIAGPTLLEHTAQIGWCEVGSAVITPAGNLPKATHVIHAVGPRWGEGSERGKLANVTWASLHLAEGHLAESVALPAISVGTLGYPVESCARIMISRIIDFTFEPVKHLRRILLCLDNVNIYSAFDAEFARQIQNLRETGEGKVRT